MYDPEDTPREKDTERSGPTEDKDESYSCVYGETETGSKVSDNKRNNIYRCPRIRSGVKSLTS